MNVVSCETVGVGCVKYLIIMELEKPYEENMKKAFEVEKKRREKGINMNDYTIFPEHAFLSEWKWFMIVDVDPLFIAQWEVDYMTLMKYQVIPIIESSKWYEFMGERWSHIMN